MESTAHGTLDKSQVGIIQKMLALQNEFKSGIHWFYWIAALSIVNSLIFITGSSFAFVFGLGATQMVDVFGLVLARRLSPDSGVIVRAFGFILDLFIAGIFALCGYLGLKRIKWAVVAGMVLYAVDAVILLAFKQWLGLVFHALALLAIWNGLRSLNRLEQMEKAEAVGDITVLQKLAAEPPKKQPPTLRTRLIRIGIILIPFVIIMACLALIVIMNARVNAH